MAVPADGAVVPGAPAASVAARLFQSVQMLARRAGAASLSRHSVCALARAGSLGRTRVIWDGVKGKIQYIHQLYVVVMFFCLSILYNQNSNANSFIPNSLAVPME